MMGCETPDQKTRQTRYEYNIFLFQIMLIGLLEPPPGCEDLFVTNVFVVQHGALNVGVTLPKCNETSLANQRRTYLFINNSSMPVVRNNQDPVFAIERMIAVTLADGEEGG